MQLININTSKLEQNPPNPTNNLQPLFQQCDSERKSNLVGRAGFVLNFYYYRNSLHKPAPTDP